MALSRPVACFHQERDSRILQRFDEISEPRNVDLGEFRAAQYEIEIAAVMASAIHTAAISPDLDTGKMLVQQRLDLLAVPRRKVLDQDFRQLHPWQAFGNEVVQLNDLVGQLLH